MGENLAEVKSRDSENLEVLIHILSNSGMRTDRKLISRLSAYHCPGFPFAYQDIRF